MYDQDLSRRYKTAMEGSVLLRVRADQLEIERVGLRISAREMLRPLRISFPGKPEEKPVLHTG